MGRTLSNGDGVKDERVPSSIWYGNVLFDIIE